MAIYAVLARVLEGIGDIGIVTPCDKSCMLEVLTQKVLRPETTSARPGLDTRPSQAMNKDNVNPTGSFVAAVVDDVGTDIVSRQGAGCIAGSTTIATSEVLSQAAWVPGHRRRCENVERTLNLTLVLSRAGCINS
jgi:hypothetical protein